MPWGLAAGAAIGAGSAYLQSERAEDAADRAADREGAASAEAIARQERELENARALLNPYIRQEQAASQQLMAQMGLGGGGGGGGGGFGFVDPSDLRTGQDIGAQPNDLFLDDMLAELIAVEAHSGYEGETGIIRGVQKAREYINELKSAGRLPADFPVPDQGTLMQRANDVVNAYGGIVDLRRNVAMDYGTIVGGREYGMDQINEILDRYNVPSQADIESGRVQAGGPGGMMGGGEFLGDSPTSPPGAGGAMTARDIMGLAGVEGLPPGVREAYYDDLMASRDLIDLGLGDFMSDEYQTYMGLTPESLMVGAEYQQSPAYQRAIEQGTRTVNQGAAGAGTLYSGARGEALRDMGQEVEQGYYFDAMNRRADMLADRRQTYGAELARRLAERRDSLGRMGQEVAAGRQQEQSFYNNYMTMLSQLASPATATNVAQMGMNIGRETGATLMDASRAINNLNVAGTNVGNAALADVTGGIMDMGSAWLSNR